MAIQRAYKIVLGLAELFFAIPVLGGLIIVAHAWTPLTALIILHAIGIFLSCNEHKSFGGHVVGIIGNILAWIPILGWIIHLIVGIILLVQGLIDK